MNRLQKGIVRIIARAKYKGICLIEKDAVVYGDCHFEGKNKISPEAHIVSVDMGFASYIGKASVISHAKIGRFCSIGDQVKLVRARHPVDGFASTHPAFYSSATIASFVKKDKYEEYEQGDDGLSLVVGNDVWVGSNVLIKAGVHIGDGAVIAMGAVVTKDVPDYAIVGGVPAKILRYRFTEKQRTELQRLKWWNKDVNWISKNADIFDNVDNLIVALKEEK